MLLHIVTGEGGPWDEVIIAVLVVVVVVLAAVGATMFLTGPDRDEDDER